jgi:hypothetical protein
MFQSLLAYRHRPLDLNASTQQTRLTVHLVTREGTIPAADAEIHIHDQDVRAVDDSGRDLFFGCFESVQIGQLFDRDRQLATGGRESCKDLDQLLAKLRIRRENVEWYLEHFGPRHHGRPALPLFRLRHAFGAETASTAQEINSDTFMHSQNDFRRGGVEENTIRTSHPSVLDHDESID